MSSSFKDSGEKLSDFSHYRIVECPACCKPVDFYDCRIICIHCGFNKEFEPHSMWTNMVRLTLPVNDYLVIPCCGEELWALNSEHLQFLENYVSAELRKREPNINKSLASRLPQWIKSAKNREAILKGIQKLKHKLAGSGYQKSML